MYIHLYISYFIVNKERVGGGQIMCVCVGGGGEILFASQSVWVPKSNCEP